jgi:hypothetical protein
MPTRRCCCGESCIIDLDDFNRPDSLTLGPKWDDYSSVWTIDNNTALATSPGIARLKTIHRVPDESMVVYYKTKNEVENSGTKYRVLVNMVDDENYHYVEFTRMGANTSNLAIGQSAAGVESIIKSDLIVGLTNTERQIVVKFSSSEICATVTNCVLSLVAENPDPIPNGFYCGMQCVNNPIYVDDFVFEEHLHTRENCDSCLCKCEGNYIPPVLIASLTGTGRMSGLNGDIRLVWNRLNDRWQSLPTVLCNTVWELFFLCPENPEDGGTAKLVVQQGCMNSDGYGTGENPRFPASWDCNTRSWTFGPYNVSVFDFACGCGLDFINSGTYTIIITEEP